MKKLPKLTTNTNKKKNSDGCHHCGRKRGRVIGDHIPPNKLTYGSRGSLPGGSYPTSTYSSSRSSSSSSSSSSSAAAAAAELASAASQFITTAARSQPRGGGYGIAGAFGRGGGSRRGAGGAEVVGEIVGGSLRLLWSAGSAALRAAAGKSSGGGGGGRRGGHSSLSRQARAWVARQRVTAQWRMKEALGLNPARQRYFPQCRPCSQLQAVAVRTGKRTLKTHAGGSKPWFYSVSCFFLFFFFLERGEED